MDVVEVLVVAGPSLVGHPELLRATAEAECRALGVAGRFVAAETSAAAAQAWRAADPAGAVVMLPGDDPETRRLMTVADPPADRTVWYDLTRTGPVAVAGGAAHLYGRGVWGLVWAIRHAVHRLRHPARRIGYGDHPEQWAELRLPTADRPPVAVLIHGGYWRSIWAADLMDALAIDLTGRGFASWNLEYRRPDRHGWTATSADIAAGLAALSTVDAALDLDRVVVLGHSAGGQLALRAAADTDRVALAVSLAGVLDLAEGHRRWVSAGAVAAALGGPPEAIPEVYAAADPMARLPLRVPQLVVIAGDDDPDLVDMGYRYAAAARAAGDPVTELALPGDHFAVIDPASEIWRATADQLERQLP
ncbi:MAG TPA: alpha/beta hydrolase [Natronosporangium sp.]